MAAGRRGPRKSASSSRKGKRPLKAASVDAYLAKLPPPKRAALQRLRKLIAAAAPGAEETMSYGIPAYKVDGRIFVWFAAFARHVSLFPGASVVAANQAALKSFTTSKGTVRFQLDEDPPAALVTRLLKAKLAELRRA